MKKYPRVRITDETLRDGLQIEREGISVEDKLQLLDMLVDAGLTRLMVGAFVNPRWSFQLPTFSAPTIAPSAMSASRDRPRHMTMLPGGGSFARAR